MSHFAKVVIKKHPAYKKSGAFVKQNDCVRSCPVVLFLLLFGVFVTTKKQNDLDLQAKLLILLRFRTVLLI